MNDETAAGMGRAMQFESLCLISSLALGVTGCAPALTSTGELEPLPETQSAKGPVHVFIEGVVDAWAPSDVNHNFVAYDPAVKPAKAWLRAMSTEKSDRMLAVWRPQS